MIRSILIKAAFVVAVLFVGQIPVGEMTVGEIFLRQVKRLASWSGGELQKTKLVASLGKELRQLSNDRKTSSVPARKEREDATPDAEGMTPADKEALLRLLE